jgi:hypothetical protein
MITKNPHKTLNFFCLQLKSEPKMKFKHILEYFFMHIQCQRGVRIETRRTSRDQIKSPLSIFTGDFL